MEVLISCGCGGQYYRSVKYLGLWWSVLYKC